MNRLIEIGEINTLKIERKSDNGFYLIPSTPKDIILKMGNYESYEVLLPNSYITQDMDIGKTIDVFIYTDSEDRVVATTIKPLAYKNSFCIVEIVDTTSFGAFANIGLPKDLLIPNNKQKTPFKKGEKRVIRIIEDEKTRRLIGDGKIGKYGKTKPKGYKNNQEVSLIVYEKTNLGFNVLIDKEYIGLIFHNETFRDLAVGDELKGYIKQIRKDGKIDVSLQQVGVKNKDTLEKLILNLLNKNNGFLPYNYKSSPQEIQNIFNMSKKNFKLTLTKLQNNNKISINSEGIKIKQNYF